MGTTPDRPKFEVCAAGGDRVHYTTRGRLRDMGVTLCGRDIRGAQPKKGAKLDCFACMKRFRDTERPPPPSRAFAPVMADGSRSVHLTGSNSLWTNSHQTLCGKPIKALLAMGQIHVDCRTCSARAKESA